MTYLTHPKVQQSGALTYEAEKAQRQGKGQLAIEIWGRAAELREEVAFSVPTSLPNVRKALLLDTVALWSKAYNGARMANVLAVFEAEFGCEKCGSKACAEDKRSEQMYPSPELLDLDQEVKPPAFSYVGALYKEHATLIEKEILGTLTKDEAAILEEVNSKLDLIEAYPIFGKRNDPYYTQELESELCGLRLRHSYSEIERAQGDTFFEASFLEELIARGYDITTLKFSISKRKDS